MDARGRADEMTRPAKLKWLLCTALGVALGGCGVFGETFQPVPVPAQKSVIYIYRPFHVAGSSNSPLITCGQESVELDPGKYHVFIQDSGPVACNGPAGTAAELKFDAQPDDQYFIKEEVSSGGSTQFTLLSASVAKPEVAECVKDVATNP